jgi:hypothetical protein
VVLEYRKIFFAFYSRERRNFIAMSLRRRDQKTPNLPEERKMIEERGRQVPNPTMEREMHNIRT